MLIGSIPISKNQNITITYKSRRRVSQTATAEKKNLSLNTHLAPKARGLFKASDSTHIYYEVYGEGKPLLMCYGLLCRREHWRHQLAFFAKHYSVVLFDYRGHQYSARPTNDQHLTLEWCARDIQDLLRHLDLKEVVALGHSMGVGVLTQALLLEPTRFKGAVFICGTVTNPFENMFNSNRMSRVHQVTSVIYDLAPSLMSKIWQKFTEKNHLNVFLTSRLGFNANTSEEHDVLNYMEGVNQTPFSIFHSLIENYRTFDGRDLLKKVACPVLLIAGAEDYITPLSLQEEMSRLLPKAWLHKLANGSHNAHTDFPKEVNALIDSFLEQIGYK